MGAPSVFSQIAIRLQSVPLRSLDRTHGSVVGLVLFIVGMACTGCGTENSSGSPTIISGDGAWVSIPPGALTDSSVDIQVQEAAPPQPAPDELQWVSGVYAFTPHGTQFTQPVTISLPLAEELDVDLGSIGVVTLGSDNDTTWITVPGVALTEGVAQFQTSSFSYYGVLAAQQDVGDDDSGDEDTGDDDSSEEVPTDGGSTGKDGPLDDEVKDPPQDDDDSGDEDTPADDDDSADDEDCSNGVDDDGDLLVDCADPDCTADPGCPAVTVSTAEVYTVSFDTMDTGLTFSTGMNIQGYVGGAAGMYDVASGVDMKESMGHWNSAYDLDLVTHVDGVVDVSTTSLASPVSTAPFLPGSMSSAHAWQSFTPTVSGTLAFQIRALSSIGGQFGGVLYLGAGCANSTPIADWYASVPGDGVAVWASATITPR
ncbi:MAG TPA: hypothetical protein DIU15_05470 [Deltaproteobacteria bacterium]|nr:hypothetical protein [Deltaproteobacteria bacterium]HCP45468.1 hypothetical protein [Deltaproteobacteria bacterium]